MLAAASNYVQDLDQYFIKILGLFFLYFFLGLFVLEVPDSIPDLLAYGSGFIMLGLGILFIDLEKDLKGC